MNPSFSPASPPSYEINNNRKGSLDLLGKQSRKEDLIKKIPSSLVARKNAQWQF